MLSVGWVGIAWGCCHMCTDMKLRNLHKHLMPGKAAIVQVTLKVSL